MAQQTAVEWLIEQLIPKAMATYDITTYNVIEKAKAMEKEQIMDAIIENKDGLLRRENIIEAENYYNKTYNK